MENLNTRREQRKEIIKKINHNPVITGNTEMFKMRVLNSLIEDLEDSINSQSKSTNRLSIVLVIATVVMAIVSVINLYIQLFH